PTMVGELGGLDHYSWVVTAYLICVTVGTPLYGKISDVYGRRIVFQTAIAIFLAGSLAAGLSQNMLQLILFRGLQGIGGGGLITMSFAIVADIVSPRERGRYTGYLGAVFAFSSIVGPLLGGFIVDHFSWRWVFLVNLPVGAVALTVTSIVLRMPVAVRRRHRIDVEGAALLVSGVTCLLLMLVWGGSEYRWGSPTILGLGAAGVVLTAAFVAWEARTPEPLLSLRLFRNPIFTLGSMLGFIVGCTMFSAIVFLPLFLQVATGASATRSGLLLLPFMLGFMATSITVGNIVSYTGRYKIWPIVGMVLAATGLYLFSGMHAGTTRVESSLFMVVFGMGIGMLLHLLVLVVQNAVDHRELGVATSATAFFRSMGGSFGVAVYGAIFNARLFAELPRLVPPDALAAVSGDATRLLNSPAQLRLLPPPVLAGIVEAVVRGTQSIFLWAMLPVALGFGLAWFLKEIPLHDTVPVSAAVEGAVEGSPL
ncbi:MAG: MFS transporter, partial [Gemmatimonadetes bacterium]|nr:MFS transporter [Gemmatimonadota bacterium]